MLFKKIFYLFLLFSPTLIAQNKGVLSGKVLDKSTGEPLINAEIIIKDLNKGTTTDDKGFYQIHNLPLGSYTVSFYYLGYQSVRLLNKHT